MHSLHGKVVHQTQDLSKEDEVPPLEFPVSETQREEEKFEDQIPNVSENTENPSEELLKVPPYKRSSAWYQEIVQEGQKHKAPLRISRERLQKYSGLMGQLDSTESPSCKEATSQQVWVDAMIEEYSSIMKNDVWEFVPIQVGKSFPYKQESQW